MRQNGIRRCHAELCRHDICSHDICNHTKCKLQPLRFYWEIKVTNMSPGNTPPARGPEVVGSPTRREVCLVDFFLSQLSRPSMSTRFLFGGVYLFSLALFARTRMSCFQLMLCSEYITSKSRMWLQMSQH